MSPEVAKVMRNPHSLDFAMLRLINVPRCEEKFHKLHDWTPTDWATAMGGECGEALNLIKKLRRLQTNYRDSLQLIQSLSAQELITNIGKEIADMVIYADLLTAALGLDLGRCVSDKFNETSAKIGSAARLP